MVGWRDRQEGVRLERSWGGKRLVRGDCVAHTGQYFVAIVMTWLYFR